jgi:transposase
MAGRQTKLTKKMQAQIVKLLKQGNTFETAAVLSGISKATFFNWMNRGETGEEPYASFRAAVEQAVAHAEAERVKIIMEAAKGTGRYKDNADWKAAAWFLERRNPEVWGRKDRISADVTHSGEVVNRNEYNITQIIEIDPEAREAAKQLFRRAAISRDME